MSTSGSAQLSPRLLSAYERLDEAVSRLSGAFDQRHKMVPRDELESLQSQLEGLNEDNLALSRALEAYNDADYDTQFEKLNDELVELRTENSDLQEREENLKAFNSDVSERLEKLIGRVQDVLEEDE